MVAVGISCCFVVLFAYTRPYLGQFAVQPVDLQDLIADLDADQVTIRAAAAAPAAAPRPLTR